MDAIGIVNISYKEYEVEGLSDYRPIPSISFLGRYRIIDFQLSSFSNSEINNVMIEVNQNVKSLADHIGTGRSYNINSKQSHLGIFYPSNVGSSIYHHDINALKNSLRALKMSKENYVIIAPGHAVVSIDYREYLKKHISSGADISVIYKKVSNANKEFISIPKYKINPQQGLEKITINHGDEEIADISLETYIMEKALLLKILESKRLNSAVYWLRDAINQMAISKEFDIRCLEYSGFYKSINSLKAYYEANMIMLDSSEREKAFQNEWPIYTKTHDSEPVLYCPGSKVKNSLISNGCNICGEVSNSILSRNVTIEKGAIIDKCIILSDCYISENTVLKNVIIDRYAKILYAKKIASDNLTYIKRDDII